MTFFSPLVLIAAAGIALPILAHLLNRFQVKHTDWAAMQFLNRSVRVRSRQLRLRDLLLLLLRCLAVLLIALAIARPSQEQATGAAAAAGEPHPGVILAIDASFSMSYQDAGVTRFAKAIERVEQIVEDVPVGSPVSLIVLGDEHQVIARNMAYDPAVFEALLRELKPSHGRLRWETVPAALLELVDQTVAVQKELHVITDMQRGDWQAPPDWLRQALTNLADQAQTFIVPVAGAAENLAITEFDLFSGLLRKGTTARYSATVHNFGSTAATNVRVNCHMRESIVDSKVIPVIGPRSSQTVSLFVPFQNAGSVTLSVKIEDDALPLDNVRRAVANIRARVAILCVEGGTGGKTFESFVVKALRARGGDTTKEDYKVQSVSWLSLPTQDLSQFDVVVLSNVPEITEQQAERLGGHVREGGGLIWFGGDNIKPAIWNERSRLEGGSLLPATITQPINVSGAMSVGQPLDPVFADHDVTRPLRSLPKDLLSETRFEKLLDVTPLPTGLTLLNLSGSDTPVVIDQSIGRGHVFMFTGPAEPTWNNMALTPVFPMLLQQMVTYLTGREFEQARLVGGSLSLSYADRPDANDGMFETPSGQIIRVPVREHDGQFVAFLNHAREAGFYQARVSLQLPGQPIAVNVDTRESDVRSIDPQAAQQSLAGTGVTVVDSDAPYTADVRTGRGYWRALLIAAFVILLIESLLAANPFSRSRRQNSAGDAANQTTPQRGGA